MINKIDRRKGLKPKRYPPWSVEACASCDLEGYAARSFSWEGVYVCEVCDAYAKGYNDAIDTMEQEINDEKNPRK